MAQMVSGVMSLFGGFMSAGAYVKSGDVGKKVQQQNAEIDEIKAKDAEDRGELNVFRHRLGVARMIGAQRAAFGASGIDVNEVDSVAGHVIEDTVRGSERDVTTIRMNAARSAWGFRQAAREDTFKGEIGSWEAEQAAVGAIFQSANGLYSKYGFSSDKTTAPSKGGGSGGSNYGIDE